MKYVYKCIQKLVELLNKCEYLYICFETHAKEDIIYETYLNIEFKDGYADYKELGAIQLLIQDEGMSIEFVYDCLKDNIWYIHPTIKYKPYDNILCIENIILTNCRKEYNLNIDKKTLIKIIKIFARLVFIFIDKILKDKQKIYGRYNDDQKIHKMYYGKNIDYQNITIMIINYREPALPFKLRSTDLFNTYQYLATKKYNDKIINATHQVIAALIKDMGKKLEKLEKRKHNS